MWLAGCACSYDVRKLRTAALLAPFLLYPSSFSFFFCLRRLWCCVVWVCGSSSRESTAFFEDRVCGVCGCCWLAVCGGCGLLLLVVAAFLLLAGAKYCSAVAQPHHTIPGSPDPDPGSQILGSHPGSYCTNNTHCCGGCGYTAVRTVRTTSYTGIPVYYTWYTGIIERKSKSW